MVTSANAKKIEEFGALLKKGGVLVTPDGKNDRNTSDPEAYGYKWNKGALYDPVTKSMLGVLGTIHTHLSTLGDASPSFTGGSSGYGDVGFAAQNTPYKPLMTIGWDKNVYGIYAYYPSGRNIPNFAIINSSLKPGGLSVPDLLHGYDLTGQLRKYIFR